MTAYKRKIRLLLAVGVLLLGVYPLAAQRTQTIQGLVTDATGAVIAGASVKIHNLGTGLVSTVTTNETGNYTFPLLVVGNYDVTCESEGFKSLTARNIRLETGAQVRQDFRLEVGDVTETVEVAASAITLNTENAVVSTTIEQKRIVELPLNGRNIVQLAVLVPGVQFGNRSGLNQGTGGYVSEGSYSVSANGIRELHQVVTMDGTDVADVRRSVTPFVPSIDAIEEFKIQTNSFSAEYGFGGGAVTQITLKSGTNELHGTMYEFLRNDKLDAEAYFLNFERPAGQPRQEKNRRRRNQFGLVFSGPIVKNKTFWMFNWEARRERETSIAEAYFPND
ncbi:MAG TPA: carboxypeptidase regulatory-like domain-containing protein, partial [Bryobacterales bacterium]|nr:carboxypeptidase regulatory-like domain-containing protein [Bryobacterales bacterium]